MHETLTHQPVAHPRRRRPVHPQRYCQVSQSLRTSRCQLDQHPILRKRHILRHSRERPSGHRHERATSPENRIDELIPTTFSGPTLGFGGNRHRVHTTTIALCNNVALTLSSRAAGHERSIAVRKRTSQAKLDVALVIRLLRSVDPTTWSQPRLSRIGSYFVAYRAVITRLPLWDRVDPKQNFRVRSSRLATRLSVRDWGRLRSYVLVVRVLLGCSLGGLGHLMPVVGVAQALGRLGHEPLVLVPPSLAEAASETGVAVRVGGEPPRPVIDAIWERVRAGPPEAVVGLIDRELFADRGTEAMLPAARDLFDVWGPEIVVREPCEYATAVLAHGAGIPQLQIGVSQSAIELGVLEMVGDMIERHRAGVVAAVTAAPYLTSFPASLDPSRWPDTRRFRLPSPAWAPLPDWWPGDRRPLVYVTFGTVLGHLAESRAAYRTVLDAVADLPARVLMTVGHAVDPAALVPVPSNTHIERWGPQSDVFREARLVVCHGGSGTTFGALAAGLPLVICPLFADQTANAQLVHEAGAGLAVFTSDDAAGGLRSLGSADVAALRGAIEFVLAEPTYRQTAGRLAREIAGTSTLEETLAQLLAENPIT